MASSITAKSPVESKNLSPVQIGLLLLIGLLTIAIVALAIRSSIRSSNNTSVFQDSSLLITSLTDIQRQTLLLHTETEHFLRDPSYGFKEIDLQRAFLTNQLRVYSLQVSSEPALAAEVKEIQSTLENYDALLARMRTGDQSEVATIAPQIEETLSLLHRQLKFRYDREELNFFRAFSQSLQDQSISENILLVASAVMSVLGAVIFISLGRSFRRLKEETTVRIQKETEAQQLAKESAILAEIGRIMNSSVDVNEVYELFAERVRQLIDFDRIVITVVNPEDGTFTIAYVSGIHVNNRGRGNIESLAGSALNEVVRTQSDVLFQPREIKEVNEQFPILIPAFQAGLRTFYMVPLISNGDVIGGLILHSITPNAYTERDMALVNQVANQIAGAIANAQLYSDRERLQEQFIQAQKMEAIGQLAGGVAHDFNNLLTPIMGYSQMVMNTMLQGDKQRSQLEEVYKAAERATGLVHQLLAFSRKQVIEPKILKINGLITDLGKMLRRLIGEDIELVTSLSEDLGQTRADPNQIDQLIMNLVVNARDAMPNGGEIRIETANVTLDEEYASEHMDCSPGQYIMITASDNGTGMTEEIKARIFEPFFTTKGVGKGTGLGLATCYGIAKQNEGHISVDSELGRGTTFKIYLPMLDGPIAADSQDTDSGIMPKGTETILLVEDEYAVRAFSSELLREQGYTVLEASDGLDALEIANMENRPRIDLLLTDVVMPRLGGKELAEEFAKIFPEARVVFASGYPDNSITREGVLEPGTIFIQKPFTPLALTRKVRETLDSPTPNPPSTTADEWVELPR